MSEVWGVLVATRQGQVCCICIIWGVSEGLTTDAVENQHCLPDLDVERASPSPETKFDCILIESIITVCKFRLLDMKTTTAFISLLFIAGDPPGRSLSL